MHRHSQKYRKQADLVQILRQSKLQAALNLEQLRDVQIIA